MWALLHLTHDNHYRMILSGHFLAFHLALFVAPLPSVPRGYMMLLHKSEAGGFNLIHHKAHRD